MEIKINVSDDKFSEIIKNEMDALSKDELVQLVKSGIKEYLMSDDGKDLIRNNFLTKKNYYGGTYNELNPWLSSFLSKSISETDFNDNLKDIGNDMITYLKDNHKNLLEKVLLSLFVDNIYKSVVNNYDFRTTLECTIQSIINQKLNNN